MIVLWVALAGGLGAVARYEISGLVHVRTGSTRPWGTLVVNVTGSLALGALVGADLTRPMPDVVVAVAGLGFLGGFTTFSTWMVETAWLAREGGRSGIRGALVNLATMMVGGLCGVGIGILVAG